MFLIALFLFGNQASVLYCLCEIYTRSNIPNEYSLTDLFTLSFFFLLKIRKKKREWYTVYLNKIILHAGRNIYSMMISLKKTRGSTSTRYIPKQCVNRVPWTDANFLLPIAILLLLSLLSHVYSPFHIINNPRCPRIARASSSPMAERVSWRRPGKE